MTPITTKLYILLTMALIIVTILLFSYVILGTETITKVNKAAVAMFAGTIGWVLYICYGTDFVMNIHAKEYLSFLAGSEATSSNVKMFIADHIFLKYVGQGGSIVLFLLATMTIVEILNNNGCFDFVLQLLKTRSSKRFLWTISSVTFLISANLDNLTTTVMMLTMMHKLIPNRRHRLLYGSAIVLAANCGGALTVIGAPVGLTLWNAGAVTATNFSMSLMLPCLVAWVIPTYLIGRTLPERVQTEWITMPYRGDDTRLNVWQRLLMLFVGIGGLWFIPTCHNITKLSPFLGACCVLAGLWMVNELFNRKLMNDDAMIQRQIPRVLQYGVIQMMLFVMGIMLALGVVNETGALATVREFIDNNINNVWALGLMSAFFSCFIDTFANAYSWFSIFGISDLQIATPDVLKDLSAFAQNGSFWKVIAFTSALGGNILAIGSMSGLALMKAERVHMWWYLKNVGWKALVGGLIGLMIMFFTL